MRILSIGYLQNYTNPKVIIRLVAKKYIKLR